MQKNLTGLVRNNMQKLLTGKVMHENREKTTRLFEIQKQTQV